MIEPIYDNANFTLDAIEKQVILNRLAHYEGDKVITAKSLGVTERTIYNKLEIYEKENYNSPENIAKREAADKELLARQRGNVKTLEQMTSADFLANPQETYGLMSNPHPPSEAAAAPVVEPVVAPVARIASPQPHQGRRNRG